MCTANSGLPTSRISPIRPCAPLSSIFSGVDYLDSAALGMLLLLREKLGNVRKEVELTGTHGMVKQVLEIANFARLFRIA